MLKLISHYTNIKPCFRDVSAGVKVTRRKLQENRVIPEADTDVARQQ